MGRKETYMQTLPRRSGDADVKQTKQEAENLSKLHLDAISVLYNL